MNSGRQIKLYGNSVSINKSLEIGEGYAPNILSLLEEQQDNKGASGLSNPHKLTVDELMDLADFNIQLWMDLKAALRRFGAVDPKIFNLDTSKAPTEAEKKSDGRRKRKTVDSESR